LDAGKEEVKDADADKSPKDADGIVVDKEGEPEKKPKKKREPEPMPFRVGNPVRITSVQSQVYEFDLAQRYCPPIRPDEKPLGVIIITDSTPDEEEDLGAVKAPSLEPEGELAPPEPFRWMPPYSPVSAASTDSSAAATSAAEEYCCSPASQSKSRHV
jgi:26S proteasome regulatory subunit N2